MATGKLPRVESAQALEELVLEIGLLPFVEGGIQGLSLEAATPRERWFVRGVEGPWEWRETVADRGIVAYGKLFSRKAGFANPDCFADLVNWRRKGMSFEERYERGEIRRMEKQIMDLLETNGPMLTRDLRRILGEKGFECAATSLQMRTDIVIQRLEYRVDAFGRPYGMGVARLAPSELALGDAVVCARMQDTPEQSFARLYERILARFPQAEDNAIRRLLG